MTPLRDADRHSWFKASPTRVLSPYITPPIPTCLLRDGERHVDVAISVRDRLWGLIQPRQLGNHTL
ncbi:hypothetical protein EXIGLDRAFT_727667 [Exidia glandulosa HHB12029]|uniref:Uncharacterized protein n=1 Tax=Exidia glandulosa HHB12029 TaxID=1314781 RepID=A0A165DA00_EXIGL|nr:hypothetical protein EXIGLDRAFT_727667 [Exidia glandulosa HHB12029]